MSIKVLYNELDSYCCAWLSNLMDKGHIRPGVISNKSIEDLTPDDVRPYDLAHFFAGIAIWDYSLTMAGWRFDGRVTWTGSCPCQPFSGAGKGEGHADKRHLWPAWERLIGQCRPDSIFGEQVSGPDGLAWLDLVCTDLENRAYAVGAIVATAAGVGAPHGRHRIYFVADTRSGGRDAWQSGDDGAEGAAQPDRHDAAGRGSAGGVADRPSIRPSAGPREPGLRHGTWQPERPGAAGKLADPECSRDRCEVQAADHGRPQTDGPTDRASGRGGAFDCDEPQAGVVQDDTAEPGLALCGDDQDTRRALGQEGRAAGGPGPVNGFWEDAEWVLCRDPEGHRWRPIKSGSFPVASGIAGRVGRLRAYGNGLCAETAVAFIRAAMT